ncbi:MAG: patatin-like phospholipase family protein [Acidobacteriota bacterium]|nr:patatin-like phospholipase family protein [Acidobacteriota bacterium]
MGGYTDFKLQYEKDIARLSAKTRARLKAEYQNPDVSQSYDILVLSGGGEYGAFGAGFLKGWGRIEEGEFARPHFDSVTGISTGSLMAPFAFVGSRASYAALLDYYRNTPSGLIQGRPLWRLLRGKSSIYDAMPLFETIRNSLTTDLVSQIARESKNNRALIVGSTNLDYGLLRVWDLADMVADQQADEARALLSRRLIASSAIPGAFPPVEMGGYSYVDGGASLQMITGVGERDWLYREEVTPFDFVQPDRPLRVRLWIIVNTKLLLKPKVIPSNWADISMRSLQILMGASRLQTLQDAETLTRMINQRPELDMVMRYVSIPSDYPILETEYMFDREKMRDLADLGERMGADPSSWREKAPAPGAAFSITGK